MSELKEKLIRRNDDDIFYIGHLIEQAKKTEFWQLLSIMTEGRKVNEIELSKATHNNFSADRILGRIEAYETLLDDMDSWLDQVEVLRRPKQEISKEDQESAQEISSTAEITEAGISYGGQV
jgi:hypothetical protein